MDDHLKKVTSHEWQADRSAKTPKFTANMSWGMIIRHYIPLANKLTSIIWLKSLTPASTNSEISPTQQTPMIFRNKKFTHWQVQFKSIKKFLISKALFLKRKVSSNKMHTKNLIHRKKNRVEKSISD